MAGPAAAAAAAASGAAATATNATPDSVLPSAVVGAAALLKLEPRADGRDIIVGIVDSGVDVGADGLRVCPDGSPKIVDSYDVTGSGDVDTTTVRRVALPGDDSAVRVELLSGREVVLPAAWVALARVHDDGAEGGDKKELEVRVGLKHGVDWYTPRGLKGRVLQERKRLFVERHGAQVAAARARVASLSAAAEGSVEPGALAAAKEEVSVLEGLMKEGYDDPGPAYDVLVLEVGGGDDRRGATDEWRVAVIADEVDSEDAAAVEAACPLLGNYRAAPGVYGKLDSISQLNYNVNIWDGGDRVEVVVCSSSHGTHVAGIVGAYYPDDPGRCGVAPGVKLVNIRLSDSRFGGDLEVNWAMQRVAEVAVRTGCSVLNMSFGEAGAIVGRRGIGRATELLKQLVHEHGILYVNSASNDGPGLHTTGAPNNAVGDAMISVAAHIFPDMAGAAYSSIGFDAEGANQTAAQRAERAAADGDQGARIPTTGISYPWSSRGPSADGDAGVTVCAPGGAIAPVPEFTLSHAQLMNGTSMSAPNCTGALATLLSALKARNIAYTPYSIRRAIQATAVRLPVETTRGDQEHAAAATQENRLLPISQGAGMIQVDKALAHCETYVPETNVRWDVSVPARGDARGILLREQHETRVVQKFAVSVTPVFRRPRGTGETADTKTVGRLPLASAADVIAFDKRVRLESSCPEWVSVPAECFFQSGGRDIEVIVDAASLPAGQVHVAEVFGYDTKEEAGASSAGPAPGPLFRICVTVVKAEEVASTAAGDDKETAKEEEAAAAGAVVPQSSSHTPGRVNYRLAMEAGTVQRRFLVPPPGVTECHVVVRNCGPVRVASPTRGHLTTRGVKEGDAAPSEAGPSVSGVFFLGGHQLLPQNPVQASNRISAFRSREGDTERFVMPVTAGYTMELLCVQMWASGGAHVLDVELSWYGVVSTPSGALHRGKRSRAGEAGPATAPALAYDASRGAVRVDIAAPPLGSAPELVTASPSLKFDTLRRLVAPSSSKVTPWTRWSTATAGAGEGEGAAEGEKKFDGNALNCAGVPGGVPVYMLTNEYRVDARALAIAAGAAKAGDSSASVTAKVWFPAYDVQLYDSALGGHIWDVISPGGKILDYGEYAAAPKVKLAAASGKEQQYHTVTLRIFHEDPLFLSSAAGSIPLALDAELAKAVEAPIGRSFGAAAHYKASSGAYSYEAARRGPGGAAPTGSEPVRIPLRPGSTTSTPIWLGAPAADALPSGAAPDDVLLGTLTLLGSDYPNAHDVVEFRLAGVVKAAPASSSAGGAAAPSSLEEALLAARVARLRALLEQSGKAAPSSEKKAAAAADGKKEADDEPEEEAGKSPEDEFDEIVAAMEKAGEGADHLPFLQVRVEMAAARVERAAKQKGGDVAVTPAQLEAVSAAAKAVEDFAKEDEVARYFGRSHAAASERDDKAASKLAGEMKDRRAALSEARRLVCLSLLRAKQPAKDVREALDRFREIPTAEGDAAAEARTRDLRFAVATELKGAETEGAYANNAKLLKELRAAAAASGNADKSLHDQIVAAAERLGWTPWAAQFKAKAVRDFGNRSYF